MPDTPQDPRRIDMPDTLEEAERFQRMFVQPVAETIRTEMRTLVTPLVDRVTAVENDNKSVKDRLNQLESSQSKALIGWGVFATGLSIVLSASWNWIKERIGL